MLLKAACFAEGSSIFEQSGHIGAATLAIVSTQSSSDTANFLKLGCKLLTSDSILHRYPGCKPPFRLGLKR
jgi:hypothetical protein